MGLSPQGFKRVSDDKTVDISKTARGRQRTLLQR